MKKIDAHLHLAKVLAGYCRRGELRAAGEGKAQWGNGEVFQLLPTTGEYGEDHFTAEQALKIMDANDVEKAVIMQGSMYGFQNAYHIELLEKYPDRFNPSCTVDPYMTNALDTLRYYLEEKKFRLVKFEISSGGGLMGCHDAFNIADPRMMEIYKLIEKNKAVVALDIGDIEMDSHQVSSVYRIADRCPDLKVVVCHLLAPMRKHHDSWLHELQVLKLANVWFDIAALPKILAPDAYPFPDTVAYLKEAKDAIGADRMMWGTDAPFAATLDPYEKLADYLEKSNAFTQEELENIYYNNAKGVYFG